MFSQRPARFREVRIHHLSVIVAPAAHRLDSLIVDEVPPLFEEFCAF
jgi:hypothetical protein